MGLASKLFLLGGDDTLHGLASTAFMRILRREDTSRLPDFAGRRVRLASVLVELADRVPRRVMQASFSIIDVGADGFLDVGRLNAQQIARADTLMAGELREPRRGAAVVDATARFVARGGSWQPNQQLLRRIEAAALGRLQCSRVRVVR